MAISPMAEASHSILEAAGKELSFQELFQEVVKKLELDETQATKRIAKMYSDLTLDKRFISLPENQWDLRKRHRLDDILIDTDDIIVDDEDLDDYDEDLDEDEEEYDLIAEKTGFDEDEDIIQLSKLASLDDED